jgi:hypothetical protein
MTTRSIPVVAAVQRLESHPIDTIIIIITINVTIYNRIYVC